MRIESAVQALVVLAALAAGTGAACPTQHDRHDHDATASHSFADVERWVEIFDDPQRDAWQHPDEVIEFVGLTEGDTVADLGAGTGYFTVRLARAVGPGGRVFAVDTEPALVEHLRRRAADHDLSQVSAVLAEPDDPKLPAGEIDLVLIVDTWHHIDDRIAYLETLGATLEPDGRVAVVDFHEGELPVGPPPGHKLSRDAVAGEFEEAGWILSSESRDLPYQYLLVFRPPPS